MKKSDDLREELMSAKKCRPFLFSAHQLALRENAHYRTRLRIAERECRRREADIERMLSHQQIPTSASGGVIGELAALRRKTLLYERMLREKSTENEKLMADKGVAKAAETRKMVAKLESECQTLRAHLAQSVPETEFLREKEQYMTIINRLVEENMHLRTVIGSFEQRKKESEQIITQLGGNDALIRQFRHNTIISRKQANFYKNALGTLLKTHRQGISKGKTVEKMEKESVEVGERHRIERRMRARSEERVPEGMRKKDEDEAEFGGRSEDGGRADENLKEEKEREEGMPNKQEMCPEEAEEEEEERRKDGSEQHGSAAAPSRTSSSSSAPAAPPFSASSTASSSSAHRKYGREEFEEDEMEEGEEEEEEEEDELHEIEEFHLNALYRILHAHILRQQMLKVRRERDSPHPPVGMNIF